MNPDLTPDIRTIKLLSGEELVAHILSEDVEGNITVEHPMKVLSQYRIDGDEEGADVAVSSVMVPWFNSSRLNIMTISTKMIVTTAEANDFSKEEWMHLSTSGTEDTIPTMEEKEGNVLTFRPKDQR